MALSKQKQEGRASSQSPEAKTAQASTNGLAELATFDAFVARYRPRLLRIVHSILRGDGDVEDVLQQVFILVYLKQSSFAGHSSFETWVTRLAINEALSHRRAQKRWQLCDDFEQLVDAQHEQRPSPEDCAALRELAQLMSSALEALPVDFRRVTVLRELHGLNGEDAARALGVTRDVVRVRLCRARVLLRQRLARQFGRAFAKDVFSGTALRSSPFSTDETRRSGVGGSGLPALVATAIGSHSTS